MLMKTFLWMMLAWPLGIIACSFFLMPALSSILFEIPFGLHLRSRHILKNNRPLAIAMIAIVVHPLVFWAITKGVYAWIPRSSIAYWIGVVFTIVQNFRKIGYSEEHIQSYIRSNESDIDVDLLK